MKNDDELLEDILAHLKSESVPEVPADLTTGHRVRSHRSLWRAVGAAALAASLVGFLLWRSYSSQTGDPGMPAVVQQPREDARELEVVRRSLDLTKPLAQLEADLDLVDAEIAELRSRAALLDAQRVVEELLARH